MSDDNRPPISGPASGKSINGLVLNLVLPGLGCLINGKSGLGAGMLVMFVAGIALLFPLWFLGLGLIVGSWIWSAVTGFQMMSETVDPGRPPSGG